MRGLPGPVRVAADAALRAAARRWPRSQRAEMAAEWAAELHAIAYEPRRGVAQRSWRSLGYALSLALARGPDSESRGFSMRRVLTPMLGLLAAPVTMAASVIALSEAVNRIGWLLHFNRPPGVDDPAEMGPVGHELWPFSLGPTTALLTAVGVGLAGRWLARRAPLPMSYPALAGLAVVTLLAIGSVAALAAGASVGDLMFGGGSGGELPGLLVWTVLLSLASTAVAGLRARRTGATAATFAMGICVGGALAWLGGALVSASGLSLIDVLLVGWGPGLFPHVLLAMTVFAVSYLIAWRGPVAEPAAPEPPPEPSAAASPAGKAVA